MLHQVLNAYLNGAAVTDPQWSNVKLLVYGEGADASTSFTDHSTVGRALTANGNVQNDTGQDVHGESILLDGNGDYISAADAADLRLDLASFCFEMYVYITNLTHTNTLLSKVTSGNSGYRFFVSSAGKLTLQFLSAGSVKHSVVSVNSVPTTQIVHLAVSRSGFASGSTGYVFIDGNLEASANSTGAPVTGVNVAMNMGFDTRLGGSSGIQGNMNWCRLTNGNARYTANFTPPATPFPTS